MNTGGGRKEEDGGLQRRRRRGGGSTGHVIKKGREVTGAWRIEGGKERKDERKWSEEVRRRWWWVIEWVSERAVVTPGSTKVGRGGDGASGEDDDRVPPPSPILFHTHH
jgi:hypothetical protein